MKNYSLLVKNLICGDYNCMQQLIEQLEKNHIHVNNILTGKIILANKPSQFQLKKILVVLRNNGMGLIIARKQMTVDKIKSLKKILFLITTIKYLTTGNYLIIYLQMPDCIIAINI